jgi:hypothetical protein
LRRQPRRTRAIPTTRTMESFDSKHVSHAASATANTRDGDYRYHRHHACATPGWVLHRHRNSSLLGGPRVVSPRLFAQEKTGALPYPLLLSIMPPKEEEEGCKFIAKQKRSDSAPDSSRGREHIFATIAAARCFIATAKDDPVFEGDVTLSPICRAASQQRVSPTTIQTFRDVVMMQSESLCHQR